MSDTILDIGPTDKICCDCGALMWKHEQTKKQQRINSNKFSLCCGSGKVRLPLLRETPPELKALLEATKKKVLSFVNVHDYTTMHLHLHQSEQI